MYNTNTHLPQQTVPYNYSYPSYYPYQQYGQVRAPQTQEAPAQMIPAIPTPAPVNNYIKGRPVVSIDEARASQIDLDGSLFVFPDLGNKKIYTKQINLDGTAAFNTFILTEEPQSSAPVSVQPINYVTREELGAILEQFKATLIESSKPKLDI